MIERKRSTDQSARRAVHRATHDAQFREALRLTLLDRELRRVARASLVEVPLPRPVRRGWERLFVVRPDVLNSPRGRYAIRVLKLVQNVELSNRRDFAKKDRYRGGRLRPMPHELGTVDSSTYWLMTPKMRLWFQPLVVREKAGYGRPPRLVTVFTVREPWMFVSKVRAHYQTTRWVQTVNTDSDEKWVDERLHGTPLKSRPWRRHVGGYGRTGAWTSGEPKLSDLRRAGAERQNSQK